MAVRFVVNGESVRVDDVAPDVSLLEWLRATGRTGTKDGCAEGECGACAVAFIAGNDQGGSRLEAVNSCLVPLGSMDGRSIITVEGVAARGGELHPVQRGMVDLGGSQCGYCTPGFVMSLYCEYYRRDRDGYDPEAIGGNLCRCTGYRPIADVARAMPVLDPADPMMATLRRKTGALGAAVHDAGGHRFVRPASLPELFYCLANAPGATLIAGGTDVMARRNQLDERATVMVSLEALPEVARFTWGDDEIVIGAGIPLATIEARLREHPGELPMFEQLLHLFSSRLIRHRATLGGNLATASPIGDSLPVLLALDGDVTLTSKGGSRRVALREFFLGYRKVAMIPGEIIESVHLQRPFAKVQRFYKVSKRELDDISTVAAAFALDLDETGKVVRFRAAYGGVAATPVRAYAVEQEAEGHPFDEATLRRMVATSHDFATPMTDHRGSAGYRRAMVGRLLEKFFVETLGGPSTP